MKYIAVGGGHVGGIDDSWKKFYAISELGIVWAWYREINKERIIVKGSVWVPKAIDKSSHCKTTSE